MVETTNQTWLSESMVSSSQPIWFRLETRSAGDVPTSPDAQVGSMLGRWKPIAMKRPYRSSYTFAELEMWFRMLWFSFLGSIWIHKWQSSWLKKPSYLIDKKTWFQASTEFRHPRDSPFVGDGDDMMFFWSLRNQPYIGERTCEQAQPVHWFKKCWTS